jgi:magnesium-transporting ATPase (P-type)
MSKNDIFNEYFPFTRELLIGEALDVNDNANVDGSDSLGMGELSRLAEEIERSLTVIGIAGVEDQVEKDAVKTIDRLRLSGIKVWLATSDCPEIALATAYSTNLIDSSMTLYSLFSDYSKTWATYIAGYDETGLASIHARPARCRKASETIAACRCRLLRRNRRNS